MNKYIFAASLIFIFLLFILKPVFAQSDGSRNYTKTTYTYKVIDGHEIKADVLRSPNAKEKQPALLWIHGGALIYGSRAALPPAELLRKIIDSKITVISIDYRLAPETKLAEIVSDVEDAYLWVHDEGPDLFNIDPDRFAVMGMSAGGYLTLLTGFRVEPRPKALVSLYGYGDITGDWYSEPDPYYSTEYPLVSKEEAFKGILDEIISGTPSGNTERDKTKFYLYCRQNGSWPQRVSGRDPKVEPDWFRDFEARKNVTDEYPPTMLLHGEKDTDVPFEQSVLMAEALKEQNIDHQFVSNAEWGHGFDYSEKSPELPETFDKIVEFLESHLK